MATNIVVTGKTYTLRSGAPMPVGGSSFILQTFMGEESEVFNYLYTETLPDSSEFRGQGGDYISGSFNRLQNKGGDSYAGRLVENPKYVEER